MTMTTSASSIAASAERGRVVGGAVAAVLAMCASMLMAYNVAPSSTVLNQALAFVGWGSFVVICCGAKLSISSFSDRGVPALVIALFFVAASSVVSLRSIAEPSSLAWASAGTIAAALLLATSGTVLTGSSYLSFVVTGISWGCLIAGLLSVVVGAIQVFCPGVTDGNWIATTGFVGRAVGNLRQPNHLSSLLLWSAVSAIWLAESRVLNRYVVCILYSLMIAGIVMTASRTGIVGVVLLALWGLFDRGLSRSSRRLLILSPIIFIAVWLALATWAHYSQHVFGAEGRLTAEGDLSSSRFGIWSNTFSLIAQHPWVGVGFGGFNFAWSLTPFPHRPVAFFDHTHNIALQFLVELGIPLGTLVLALMTYALWRAFVNAKSTPGLDGIALRSAFMMVLMMALHSQLEYPLWYAYFLLPTAIVFGLCLGKPPSSEDRAHGPGKGSKALSIGFVTAGLVVMVSGVFTLYDYMKVVAIFSPTEGAAPLPERIAKGQRSWFFSHHADYAAVTTTDHPSEQMDAFKGATHYLLDTRLMIAWAKAYAEKGDLERARNIAERLREFHNEKSDDFFAECDDAPESGPERPFQCDPPKRVLGPEDFR